MVYWFILLILLVPAADALGLTAVSNILNTLVAFLPNVFVAILVLFLGTLAATVVAAVAIAFGLAFGLGGQDAARRWLARGDSTISTAASQISAQQPMNQMENGTPTQTQTDQMRTRQPNH